MDQTLNAKVRRQLEGRLIGHILPDSTAIEAREKPEDKKRVTLKCLPSPPRLRGRPRKDEPKVAKKMKRLAKQARQEASVPFAQLDMECAWA